MNSWFLTNKQQRAYYDKLDSRASKKQRQEEKIFESLVKEKLARDQTFEKMYEDRNGVPDKDKWLREIENFGIPLLERYLNPAIHNKTLEKPTVIIDTSQEAGVTSFVIGIARGINTPEYVDKIRKVFYKHHRYHRNFNRKGKAF